jgi:hypothetical protein
VAGLSVVFSSRQQAPSLLCVVGVQQNATRSFARLGSASASTRGVARDGMEVVSGQSSSRPERPGMGRRAAVPGSLAGTTPQLRKEYNRGGGGVLALLRDTWAAEPASPARPVGSTTAASAHPNGQASICTTKLRAELRAEQEKGARSRGVIASYAAK